MNIDDGGLFDCRPVLCVDNVARGIAYYVDRLGFRLGWAWSDTEQRFLEPSEKSEPGFALVVRGRVQVMLSQKSQGAPGMWLHLDVRTADELDTLHREWMENDAEVIEPPSIRSWGMYEMRARDPDGHVMRVSSPARET
jgi:uncharacterized glyoxalase superfamily protein PhnB